MDYLIKNGRIADKNGCYEADLIIKNGKITYVGDGLDATGAEVIDASGCYVLPGFIDTHTHFDLDTGSAVTADDFITGSRAATLAKIAGASTIEQAEAILTEQKSLLNVKGFGSPASCRNSSQSYWVVATNNGVTILSPERDGKRWDYKTGNEDSLGKYNSRLWFRL